MDVQKQELVDRALKNIESLEEALNDIKGVLPLGYPRHEVEKAIREYLSDFREVVVKLSED